jgi:hypothetical protein
VEFVHKKPGSQISAPPPLPQQRSIRAELTGELPQAGMGIASLVIGAIGVLSAVLMEIVIRAMADSDLRPADELSPIYYVIGGWIFGTCVVSLTGIVFGIGGLLQKQRRRQCAAIGLIVSVLVPIAEMAELVIKSTFQQSVLGNAQKPVEIDPDGWHSLTSQLLGLLMVGIVLCLVIRLWQKRHPAQVETPNPCSRCRKLLPATSQFCRRCGLSRSQLPTS